MLAHGRRFFFSERAPAVNPADQQAVAEHLLARVRQVQIALAWPGPPAAGFHEKFADLLDSMGLVEFLLQLAEDFGTTPEIIEQAVNRQFGTIRELAGALLEKALTAVPKSHQPKTMLTAQVTGDSTGQCWLVGSAVSLPSTVQSAKEIDRRINHPEGWLLERTGIQQRRIWGEQDPLTEAAQAGRACLGQAGLSTDEVGALLVTTETPPLLVGLAAAIHQRLGLAPDIAALDIGGACTGFLAALWLARDLVGRAGSVLIIALEAASKYLHLVPGPDGEFAALFGDGAAACLLRNQPAGNNPVLLNDVVLGTDGSGASLLKVTRWEKGSVSVEMMGKALSSRAVRTMAQATGALATKHDLDLSQLAAVITHGGNGRMPPLLARHLGLPSERVWSETASTGNLGSASLPIAWALRGPVSRPVLWTAVGAGLTWGAALSGNFAKGGLIHDHP
jgi:3-oxoacyl-[acyl-carrier-protein] synthase III